MSVLQLHRIAIVDMLEAVAGIGIVHPEEPYAKTQAAFQAAYQWEQPDGSKQLRGWFLRRTGTSEVTLGVGRVLNSFNWRIQGFMALQTPGSGIEFDELVESIRKAFRNDETLGGVAQPGPLNKPTGVQVVDSSPVMFAGVLCHGAALQLQTYAYLNPGE